MEKYLLTTGNKRIKSTIFYQVNSHEGGIETRCCEEWRSVGSDGIFNFRIADDGNAFGR